MNSTGGPRRNSIHALHAIDFASVCLRLSVLSMSLSRPWAHPQRYPSTAPLQYIHALTEKPHDRPQEKTASHRMAVP